MSPTICQFVLAKNASKAAKESKKDYMAGYLEGFYKALEITSGQLIDESFNHQGHIKALLITMANKIESLFGDELHY